MKRVLVLAAAVTLTAAALAPAAFAAEPFTQTGRVLVSTEGDVAIKAGEHADVVVVVNGNADIRGEVNTLVVVDGTATLVGATLETAVVVGSQVELGAGTAISGSVQQLDSTVQQSGNVTVQGGIVDLAPGMLAFGGAIAAALLLLWIGFGLANIIAGLLLAAVAARQVRAAQELISREPVLTFVAGLLAAVLIPIAAVLLFPTVVLAPLGFSVLVVALPLVAFGGYLVAAAWIGDWLLRLLGSRTPGERPYLPIVLGVVVLGVVGLVPVAGLLVAIASLFGFGAVILGGIRTMTSARNRGGAVQAQPAALGA